MISTPFFFRPYLHATPRLPKPDAMSARQSPLQEVSQVLAKNLAGNEFDGVERILPATPEQEALVADMLRSQFRQYYNHDVVRLFDGTDAAKLRRSWQMVSIKE